MAGGQSIRDEAGIEAWLSHYVRLGFYYVAFRFEPAALSPEKKTTPSTELPLRSETVRISFKTPVAYYPYLEPQLPDPSLQGGRLLDLWVVSPATLVPVGLQEEGVKRSWVRPMRSGRGFAKANEKLSDTLGSEIESLLPQGELVLQTFQDQKTSRRGFGDVLFVPFGREAVRPSPERLKPLVGLLDPELVPKDPHGRSP